jgi:hypothetical protein
VSPPFSVHILSLRLDEASALETLAMFKDVMLRIDRAGFLSESHQLKLLHQSVSSSRDNSPRATERAVASNS